MLVSKITEKLLVYIHNYTMKQPVDFEHVCSFVTDKKNLDGRDAAYIRSTARIYSPSGCVSEIVNVQHLYSEDVYNMKILLRVLSWMEE